MHKRCSNVDPVDTHSTPEQQADISIKPSWVIDPYTSAPVIL